jgi:hypothetical protein
MEEREPFFERGRAKIYLEEGTEVKLVAAYTKEGAIFDSFELVLPKGSIVSRGNDHSLLIDTKRFSLRFETLFEGFGSVLPRGFEKFYLG